MLVLLLVGGAGAFFWRDIEAQLRRRHLDLAPVQGGALNVLVIGSDSREGISREDVRRFGRVGGRRADTIILVQAVPSQRRAVLVHFPRDLWVAVPGRGNAKINSVYEYGPRELIETIETLTGVPINHYVEVNLVGFRRLVDAIGGVDVCLDRPLYDSELRFRLPAGPSHLNGEAALSFVRARHADPDGDFGRIRRQQQFLRAVAAKVGQPSVLLNPWRVRSLARVFGQNVTVDTQLQLLDVVRLARSVRSFGPEHMQTYTVPGDVGRAGGQSVVILDGRRAEPLFAALREVRDPREALAPAPIQLSIEDASGRGLGETVAAQLRGRGFVVSRVWEAARVQAGTVVFAPRVAANEAREVTRVVAGGAALQLSSTTNEITLRIGSRFAGLTRPPQGEAPQPAGPCASWRPGA